MKRVKLSTYIQAISGLRFFFQNTLHRRIEIDRIPLPRYEKKLPAILSKPEVKALLEAPREPPHPWHFWSRIGQVKFVWEGKMRVACVLTLVLLSVPAALWSQGHGSQFKDLISWGPNKETFKVTLTIRHAEGAFIVSEQGFRWILIGGVDTGTGPIPWEDIRSWSCGRPIGLTITTPQGFAEMGLQRDDLLKVVNQYLKKYAPAALDAAKGCSLE
jgi:hypothetical protein